MSKPQDQRICIVGGGPAGLSAAYYLQRRGFRRVTVLEKRSEVGGKCRTLEVSGYAVDLGALEVAQGYRDVRGLAREMGAPLRRSAKLGIMNLEDGTASSSLKSLTAGTSMLALGYQSLRYLYYTCFKYRAYLNGPGMAGVPAELTVPLATWLTQNKMPLLQPIFVYSCVNFGYGPMTSTPAAYLMRFVNASFFLEVLKVFFGLRRWPRIFVHGYQSLWQLVAQRLDDVRRDVRIRKIERRPGNEGIVVHFEGSEEPETFDFLIMACCLDSSLGSILDDLTPDEKALFDKVRHKPFTTSVCPVDTSQAIALGSIPEPPAGHVQSLIQAWEGVQECAFYVTNGDGLSRDEIHRNIRDDMAKIRSFDGKPVSFDVGPLLDYVAWDYFPHVDSAELAAGFYDRVEALQGQRNTYFAGSLLSFETVSNTVSYSRALVERYFGSG